jgi:hypothetical protein
MTHDFGNPSPGLGQALKCGGIQVNGIPTLLMEVVLMETKLEVFLSCLEISSDLSFVVKVCHHVYYPSITLKKTQLINIINIFLNKLCFTSMTL